MMFLLDIAIATEVMALVAGALLLAYSEKGQSGSTIFLKGIAYFAMIVAVGGIFCSVYYGFKYREAGAYKIPMLSQEIMNCSMIKNMKSDMMKNMMPSNNMMNTNKPRQMNPNQADHDVRHPNQ